MTSLDEAFQSIVEDKEKTNQERTLKSLLKEREIPIIPFTQKQNEMNGNIFLDNNTKNFPTKK